MITNCFGGPFELYGLEERDFFSQVATLMIVVVPAGISYALWRIFVTNKAGSVRTTVLGLNGNSATYPEMSSDGISWRTLFLYALVGVTLAYEAFWYLMDQLFAGFD